MIMVVRRGLVEREIFNGNQKEIVHVCPKFIV